MKYLLFTVSVLSGLTTFGQKAAREIIQITASRTTSPLNIDGELGEEVWKSAVTTTPFINKWPVDSGQAEAQTRVALLYDDDFLYVSFTAQQAQSDLVIQSLKRDQLDPFWGSENIAVVVDPLGQKSTGFFFGVNAGGAQLDAMLTLQGAWTSMNENWDNKWYSAVKVYSDHWVTEMAIPFSALRFNKNTRSWSINFIRTDKKRNIFSTWSQVPIQFNGIDLGHFGVVNFEGTFSPRQSKVTLLPFVYAGKSENPEEGVEPSMNVALGMDAKVALTSSLNLDLTYRPDFSNAEVDKQVTNLSRFSIFFPERRNFFLENADLFSNLGSWQVRPFFSRKIGIHDGQAIPIRGGVRITGNLSKSLRIGIMDIQTSATDEFSANNYLVAAAQQSVLKRSNIKVMAANRQISNPIEGDAMPEFNRTYGAEFNYISPNGKFTSSYRVHGTQTPDKLRDGEYFSIQNSYNSNNFYAGVMAERVGQNYINDFGFVPRLYNHDAVIDSTIRIGHYTINPWIGLLIRPKKGKINVLEPNTWSLINYRHNGELLERNTSLNLEINFKNTAYFFVEAMNTDARLPVATGIIDSDVPLPAAQYVFTQYSARYFTDRRASITADAGVSHGGFYTGTRTEFGGSVNARIQPWGNFGVSYLQNEVDLGGEYGDARFVLIGPRTEISFRNNLWWTTFLQYNTQAENFNINSRLQWRFKPMSDVFVVYSDNYATGNFGRKNRGIVVKFTYWLNL